MPFRDGITTFPNGFPFVCRQYPPDSPPPKEGEEVLDLEDAEC